MSIKESIDKLNNTIAPFKGASLLAVSKTKPASDIQTAYECNQRDFGENKVQELLDKSLELKESCPDIKWHFIGGLQSNKINMLLKTENLVSIHSIDSIKLLNKLISKNIDKNIGIFLQVNTSREQEKGGFAISNKEEIFEAVKLLREQTHFFLQGLMTIGKIRTENFEEDAIICFQELADLKSDICKSFDLETLELSMGMSSDYPMALKLGTNWVRIGSNIFGSRN
jgi:pyridoxal phosphate enzyme (YggS family)